MLSLMLLLLTAPQVNAPAPPAEPPPVPASRRLAEIRERLGASNDALRRCRYAEVRRAGDPVRPLMDNLLYRDTDEVRSWLLLERSVNGCSVPISWPYSGARSGPSRAPDPVPHASSSDR